MTSRILDPLQKLFGGGSWGWDMTQWRKTPIPFGPTLPYAELISQVVVVPGIVNLQATNPGSSVVRVVTHILASNYNTICGAIRLFLNTAGQSGGLQYVNAPPAYSAVTWQGWIVYTGTSYPWATFTGCLAGDNLRFYVSGFDMRIDQ